MYADDLSFVHRRNIFVSDDLFIFFRLVNHNFCNLFPKKLNPRKTERTKQSSHRDCPFFSAVKHDYPSCKFSFSERKPFNSSTRANKSTFVYILSVCMYGHQRDLLLKSYYPVLYGTCGSDSGSKAQVHWTKKILLLQHNRVHKKNVLTL